MQHCRPVVTDTFTFLGYLLRDLDPLFFLACIARLSFYSYDQLAAYPLFMKSLHFLFPKTAGSPWRPAFADVVAHPCSRSPLTPGVP